MREQNGTQTTTKRRKVRQTSEQNNVQDSVPQRPANDDKEGWKAYWKKLGQPWRLEPEIEALRQKYLMGRRSITPNVEKSIYPFSGIKLSRADVEWLLATHDNGLGPVNWDDEDQRNRKGLDLRGADLSHVDLSNLPLARMLSGLIWDEWPIKTDKEPSRVMVQMAGANLSGAHLEKAYLTGACLTGANLSKAHLTEANLICANLVRADLSDVDLEKAQLGFAHLEEAQLLRANLKRSHLDQAYLTKAQLHFAHLEQASLGFAHLECADCMGVYMQGVIAIAAYLEGTNLEKAHLEDGNFSGAYLSDVQLSEAYLAGCHLNEVFLADEKGVGPLIADLHWGDANLAVVNWSPVDMLGYEYQARQKKLDGKVKDKFTRIEEHETAIRANRQLTIALQNQGLNDDAARFAYRTQVLQRKVFWMQGEPGKWLFSHLLSLLAGYGYKMWHILVAYILIVSACAVAYFIFGIYHAPHLSLLQAFLESITAFHGRVFSELFEPGSPQIWVTAFEAIAGLVIEGIFIAMLAQRFFGK